MHFSTKNYLKSNRYYTTKHTPKLQPLGYVSLAWSFCFVVSCYDGPIGLLILPFLGFIYFAYQKTKGSQRTMCMIGVAYYPERMTFLIN